MVRKKQETFLHVVSMALMMDNEVNGFTKCLSVLLSLFLDLSYSLSPTDLLKNGETFIMTHKLCNILLNL